MAEALSLLAEVSTPIAFGSQSIILEMRPTNGLTQFAGWDDFDIALKPILARVGLTDGGSFKTAQATNGVTAWRIAPDKIWIEGATDLADYHSDELVTLDLGHARTVITVSGKGARDLLACVISIDIGEAVFQDGDFVQTGIHGVGVLIQCRHSNRFDILVPSTWARAVWDLLADTSAFLGNDG